MKKICTMVWVVFLFNLYWPITENRIHAQTNDLLISEVYYDTVGDDNLEEWIEIYNPTNQTINLSNYKIGDEETKGGNEGMYQFPPEAVIAAGEQKVIAKNAIGFYALYKKYPDWEILTTDDEIGDFSETPDMNKYSSWGSGSLSFTNTGDEVLLINENDIVVDAVVFESGSYENVVKNNGVATGHSISRILDQPDTDNCQNDFEDEVVPHPGYDNVFEAGDYFSQVGVEQNDNNASKGTYWSAENDQTVSGYLFYGPYVDLQPTGMYQVLFRLKTNNNTTNETIVRIDANNNDGSGNWEYKEIKGNNFYTANSWQDFSLYFDRINEGNMEFRVWFNDKANIGLDNIRVGKVDRMIYEAEDLAHNLGIEVDDTSSSGGKWWQTEENNFNNHLIFGPYNDLPIGNYRIKYIIKTDDNSIDNKILTLDINTLNAVEETKIKEIKGSDFKNINKYQAFNIWITRNQETGKMEYRAFYHGGSQIVIDNIIIIPENKIRYEAEDLLTTNSQIVIDEEASGSKIRQILVGDNDQGWSQFGPYTTEQKPGNYRATFRLRTKNNSSTEPITKIDVFNANGFGEEAGREILGIDFTGNNTWQEFSTDFTRTDEGTMEYRIYFYDLADIDIDWVDIEKI